MFFLVKYDINMCFEVILNLEVLILVFYLVQRFELVLKGVVVFFQLFCVYCLLNILVLAICSKRVIEGIEEVKVFIYFRVLGFQFSVGKVFIGYFREFEVGIYFVDFLLGGVQFLFRFRQVFLESLGSMFLSRE